jgi:hypothetical protein
MTNPADRLIVCASPLMLDTLKTVHAQLIDWGKRNGMHSSLILAVHGAITEAEPGWRSK